MNIEKITQGKNLTDTERTVLEYILDHLDTVQTEGVRGVARANYTSTSTIMRLARKMNYSGFVDMCYKLRSLVETPHQTMQEEEDFLNGFSTQSLLNYNTYTQLKICADKLLEQRDKMIFVYGTGFSGTVATYLTQKLVNMGILCFSATGGDSVGIFENTLDRMGLFFGISKSGETTMVRDKIRTARENGVFTVAITGEQENSVGRYADLWFRVENQWKLDDQNTMPNTFFPAGDDAHRADRLRVPPPVHGKRHQVRMFVRFTQKNHGLLNKSNRNALLFWVTRFQLFKNCLHLRWFVG